MGHRLVGAAQVCRPRFPFFVFDVGKLERADEMHVDLAIVPPLVWLLLSANAGNDVLELLDVSV